MEGGTGREQGGYLIRGGRGGRERVGKLLPERENEVFLTFLSNGERKKVTSHSINSVSHLASQHK